MHNKVESKVSQPVPRVREGSVVLLDVVNSVLYLQSRSPCVHSCWQEDAEAQLEALPRRHWTRPPVPTELISVHFTHWLSSAGTGVEPLSRCLRRASLGEEEGPESQTRRAVVSLCMCSWGGDPRSAELVLGRQAFALWLRLPATG